MAKKSKKSKQVKLVKKAAAPAKPKGPGMIGIKADAHTRKIIEQNAQRYAGGNISAWLRQSGQKYKPAQAKKAA